MFFVRRFAENLSVTCGDGIRGNNQAGLLGVLRRGTRGKLLDHVARFLIRELGDHLGRSGLAASAALRIGTRYNDLENVSRFGDKLTPARRATCENQAWLGHCQFTVERRIVASLEVLYEDNHLLAVNKPAMLPTMGVDSARESLLDVAKAYIAAKYDKPGNVYLGIVSRLDAPVTGVVLLARTSKSAARLTAAFRDREVHKEYLAVVEGEPDSASGELVHFLRHDERHRKVHVTSAQTPDAQEARLRYRVLGSRDGLSLLQIELLTGRKHQIRVQLAKVGCPVAGDRKYGSQREFSPGIALHSWRLALDHPVRHEPLEIVAPLPRSWR